MLTVPLFFVLAIAGVPLLVAMSPAVVLVDTVRRSRWATARALAFFAIYILCEVFGIIAATLVWIRFRLSPGMSEEQYLRSNFHLQCRWASALYRGIQIVFGIETTVDGDDCIPPGPIIVFSRHASTGDTIIPAVFVSSRHDILLRYVLKRELLWDPCLDIVGNRLRNYFVDRRSTDSSQEIERVAALADGIGEREGVMIYPEGTRFSEPKRARALERLADGADRDLVELGQSMRHVLPPKLGGPLALLQRNREADLILLAHTGFEDVESLASLLNGSLIGREIRIHFQRIERESIPADEKSLRHWLFDIWVSIDRWIDRNQPRLVDGGA